MDVAAIKSLLQGVEAQGGVPPVVKYRLLVLSAEKSWVVEDLTPQGLKVAPKNRVCVLVVETGQQVFALANRQHEQLSQVQTVVQGKLPQKMTVVSQSEFEELAEAVEKAVQQGQEKQEDSAKRKDQQQAPPRLVVPFVSLEAAAAKRANPADAFLLNVAKQLDKIASKMLARLSVERAQEKERVRRERLEEDARHFTIVREQVQKQVMKKGIERTDILSHEILQS